MVYYSYYKTGGKKTGSKKEYIASYNYFTKNYEFCGKRFLEYDDVIKEALQM